MKKSVLKASALVFVLSLTAKVIGFLKSIIQASYFGTTIRTDAFNVANGFVNNILYMFTTAVAVAFVPQYVQHKQRGLEKQFATRAITALALLAVLVSAILALAAPLVVSAIAPSYTGTDRETTILYFRVLMIGFTFSLTTHMFTRLLNAEKVYGFSTFCSIINSVVLVAFILLFARAWGVWTLVVAVPASYFIQWLVLYFKGRKYATISLKYGLKDEGIKTLALLALPILVSQATVEINQVVDRALLTSVGTGALTAVSYSAVLYQFVTTIINTPLSTVMFTELSEAGAKGDRDEIRNILHYCYKIILLVCIPVVAIMFFLSKDIVTIVYGHGRFTAEAVENCAVGLRMYGLCLLPGCSKAVLNKAYYALNDTRRPMVIGMMEVALNIGLSVLLVRPFGIAGVVGATAIASLVFIVVMLVNFNRKYIKVVSRDFVWPLRKILLAAAVLVSLLAVTESLRFHASILNFAVKTLLGFALYGGLLAAMKEKTLYAVIKKGRAVIRSKLRKRGKPKGQSEKQPQAPDSKPADGENGQ